MTTKTLKDLYMFFITSLTFDDNDGSTFDNDTVVTVFVLSLTSESKGQREQGDNCLYLCLS